MTAEIRTRLREARQAAKLSQLEVARELGLSHQTLSKWERSGPSMPGALELAQLCALYGTSADFILYGIRALPAVLSKIVEAGGGSCAPSCQACALRTSECAPG